MNYNVLLCSICGSVTSGDFCSWNSMKNEINLTAKLRAYSCLRSLSFAVIGNLIAAVVFRIAYSIRNLKLTVSAMEKSLLVQLHDSSCKMGAEAC
ncbi:unnamed protein product [Periconia digitata]|uniref:Uncharacterized protein n=1 Tax=Periconia digitata TaxID=1303443 RepID=A0A9W4XP75_9PLEO|nr:unnamed protein product [Periconia digitata]